MSHDRVLCICKENVEKNCDIHKINTTADNDPKKNLFDDLDDLTKILESNSSMQKAVKARDESAKTDNEVMWRWNRTDDAYCYYILLFNEKKRRVRRHEILADPKMENHMFPKEIEHIVVFTLFEKAKLNQGEPDYSHEFVIIRMAAGNEYEMVIDLLSRVRQQDRTPERRCEVYFGFLHRPGTEYKLSDRVALKREDVKDDNESKTKQIREEMKLAREAGGKHNMKYLAHTHIEENVADVWIAMELCCMDTLNTLITKKTQDGSYMTDFNMMKIFFRQILLGLSHLHSKNIAHREMIMENILLSLDLKIGDYDHVKQVREEHGFSSQGTRKVFKTDLKMTANMFFMCIRRNVKDESAERFRSWALSPETEWSDLIPISNSILPKLGDTNEGDNVKIQCPQIWPAGMREIANVLRKSSPDCPDPHLSAHLILHMVWDSEKIDAESVLKHPFFWDEFKILSFIARADAFFHTQQRGDKERHASEKVKSKLQAYVLYLWPDFDWWKTLQDSLNSERYSQKSKEIKERVIEYAKGQLKKHDSWAITGLLRVIRNVHNHFHTAQLEKSDRFFASSLEVWDLFNTMYPGMICLLHRAIWESLDYPKLSDDNEIPDDLRRFFKGSVYTLDLSGVKELIE